MVTFLLILLLLGAYSIVIAGVTGALTYIRNYDEDRAQVTSRDENFKHDADGVEVILATLWPVLGIPALIYHLGVVGWNRDERKLMKELKREKVGGKLGTADEIRTAIDRAREKRQKQLEKDIESLREKAEA